MARTEIGQRTGLSFGGVGHVLQRLGLSVTQNNYRSTACPWSPEEDAELRKLWRQRPKIAQVDIGRAIGRTESAIKARVHVLGLPPRVPSVKPAESIVDHVAVAAPNKPAFWVGEFASDEARKRLEQANLDHLNDLDTAGHSPDQSELRIASDGAKVVLPSSLANMSMTGSQASMCAEA